MSEYHPAPKAAHLTQKSNPNWGKRMARGIVIVSLLFFIAILFLPMVVRTGCKGTDITEALHNARQINLALLDFETEYGAFPSDTTAALVTASHPAHGFDLSGKSSNALFLQLFAANLTQSEMMFYAHVKNARKADGVIAPGETLKKSEVGFAYVSGLSSADDPATPIVLSPMIPGTTRFDPKGFNRKGEAVVLFRDGSVRTYKIEKDGHIYDKGIDLLSSKHPIWKGKAPDIRYPEF